MMQSPLRVAERQAEALVTPLALDGAAYQNLKTQAEVRLIEFSLGVDRKVDLDLKRIDAFTPGAQIVLVRAGGEVQLPKPDVVLLTGTVVGHADSSAFLSMSPHGTRGWIEFGGDRFVISSGPGADRTKPVIYNADALPADRIKWMEPWTCETDNLQLPAGAMAFGGRTPGATSSAAVGGGTAVYDVQVAVETDFEFTNNRFGGNTDAATAYVATMFAAASEIYIRDVGTRLSVNFLRLWETSNDPWTASSSTSAQLSQFRSYWLANETHVFRHLTHFLSGRGLGGGVAWLDAICSSNWNYALSANLSGFFPYPLQTNNSSNWDIVVVTHEIGHNFGTVHTHNMSPPVDGCGNGDCSAASSGTIMSYCHLCSPGMSNIALRFHERVIFEQILPFLQFQVPCEIGAGPASVFAQPSDAVACTGGIARLSVGAGGTSPIQLQWRKDGVDIPSGTSSVLTLDPLSSFDDGAYDVVVTNGEGSSTSDAAILAVTDCGPPEASSSGCRALRLEISDLGLSAPVAYRVAAPALPCLSSYVRLDGGFGDEAEFHPAGEWAGMLLVGPEIIPGTEYEVRMDFGATGDPRLTSPSVVTTAVWGDVAGTAVDGMWGPPDGNVVIDDVLAGIAFFVNAPGAPLLEHADIYPATPDGFVEIIDVLQAIGAFQGLPYPFSPPGCP